MALSWTIASAISSVQRMPERSIRSLMRFLHAPSTGPLAMGQPLARYSRSEEHTSELQSPDHLVCRLLLEKKKKDVKYHSRGIALGLAGGRERLHFRDVREMVYCCVCVTDMSIEECDTCVVSSTHVTRSVA